MIDWGWLDPNRTTTTTHHATAPHHQLTTPTAHPSTLSLFRYGLGSIYFRQEKYELDEYHFGRALHINDQSSVRLFMPLFLHVFVCVLHINDQSSVSRSWVGGWGLCGHREMDTCMPCDVVYASALTPPPSPFPSHTSPPLP